MTRATAMSTGERAEMARRARRHISDHFDARKQLGALVDHIEDVLR